ATSTRPWNAVTTRSRSSTTSRSTAPRSGSSRCCWRSRKSGSTRSHPAISTDGSRRWRQSDARSSPRWQRLRRERTRERLMAGWIPPTILYIFILGAGGVTAKLALRTITWEQLVLWVPIAYIVFTVLLVVFRGATLPVGVGGAWAAVTAFAASSALILFFYAL